MATVRVQLRRGTEQQWYDANPVLAAGEVGIETDTNTFKFGDGSTAWRVLDYALSDTVDDYIPLSTKGVANGVASLDSSGFIPTSQLPPLAKVTVNAVANTAARLALTAETGDIAIESDSGQSYVLSASPASTDGNWKALVGSEAVVDLANLALVASTGLSKTYDDSAGTITFSASSAIATAAADATTKADAAAATAASDATSKVAAEAALRVSGDSASVSTAAGDATTKADAAQAAAVSTAAGDATTKANAAQAAAISTASGDATTKANAAQAAAISTASGDATTKANAAREAAIDSAATDATTKANAAAATAASYTTAQIDALVASAPGALNTLNEIATALGNDANLSATLTTAIGLKAPIASPTFTGTVSGITKTMVGLDSVDNTADTAKPVSTAQQTVLDSKAPIASPTFTGTVSGISKTMVGLGSADNTADTEKPVSTAQQTALDLKAPLASPTFTGTVTLPSGTVTSGMIADGTIVNADVSATAGIETSKIEGLDAALEAKLASATAASTYAPIASPTFTGTVSGISKTMVGLGSADNTADTAKPVSTAQQTALDLKAPLASPTFTGTVTLPSATVTSGMIADGTVVDADVSATAEIAQSKISGLSTSLGLKANLASPTFTGTVSGITKTMVGLDSVDNTADTAKPVSTAQQTALDLKLASATAASTYAPLASPTLTGVPVAPTAAVATNTTQIATTAYVRGEVAALVNSAGATLDTLGEIATALGNDANLSATLTTAIGLKAPLASPTFTGTNTVAALTASGLITASASGVAFTDGTQTKAGVPSLTTIGTTISAAYNLSTGGLTLRDQLIPISGTYVVTVPTNATTAFPVGTSIDFYQSAGTVASFAGAVGVTIQSTPGLKLRTTYSSATLTKVATDTWLLAGDLTA